MKNEEHIRELEGSLTPKRRKKLLIFSKWRTAVYLG